MPQKPPSRSPLPVAPARAPAAHVQAAVVKVAQAKTPAASTRPLAPHVQSALRMAVQASAAPRAAGDPGARVPAQHVRNVVARAAQAKLGNVVPQRLTARPAGSKGTIQLSALAADEAKEKVMEIDEPAAAAAAPAGRPRRASAGTRVLFESAESVKLRMREWALGNPQRHRTNRIDVFCKKIADQVAADLKIGEGTVAVAILLDGTYVVARLQSALSAEQVRDSVAVIEAAESVTLPAAPTTTAPSTNLHAEMMIWLAAPTMMEVAASRPCCKLCAMFLESKGISYPEVGDWPQNGWINPETREAYVA